MQSKSWRFSISLSYTQFRWNFQIIDTSVISHSHTHVLHDYFSFFLSFSSPLTYHKPLIFFYHARMASHSTSIIWEFSLCRKEYSFLQFKCDFLWIVREKPPSCAKLIDDFLSPLIFFFWIISHRDGKFIRINVRDPTRRIIPMRKIHDPPIIISLILKIT